jgi:tetratricopeptide (TPR) repeat protein
VLLVPLVLVFAFLLGSFPARNSDLWRHLAAGNRLAEVGPFAAGAGPGWLFDLTCYGLYTALDGPGLVLVKALLVAGLALALLRLSWAGQGWWVAAGCAALALLAISTRLLVQPATVSYLLLALTLYCLWRREDASAERPPLLPAWPLLLLFVAWVNVDGWFILGLAVTALVWLGQALDGAGGGRFVLRRAFSLTLLAAVCLLNPAGPRAFAVPPELMWFGSPAGPSAPHHLGRVISPFDPAYLQTVGQTPAGLAYFPLLPLSLLSFIPGRSRRWERLLPWLALAVLSAVQARAVPFFAVAAGPALALNFQDLLAHRAARRREPATAARALALIAGVTLLVCAWPGWLQAPPFEPRRWAVEPPPSLQAAAEVVRRWHEEGRLRPETRGLHLSAETAHAFAWFCPEENGLLDPGLSAAVRGEPGAPEDWVERMRTLGVHHVILYDADRARLEATLARLLAAPARWPLLGVEGDVAVFGWRDPAGARENDRFRDWRLDTDRLAFRPAEEKKAPQEAPEQGPQARPWWSAFWQPAPPRPIDRDEATLHLLHAEALRRSALMRHGVAWGASQSAGLAGAAGGWTGPTLLLDALARVPLLLPPNPKPAEKGEPAPPGLDLMVMGMQQGFVWQRDDTPPALLYLAIRAARRAIAQDPHDARAHHVLGESYLLLLHGTAERAWSRRFPDLVRLRCAQASAALNRAVTLDPDLSQAHRSLAGLYQEMNCLDLALRHLRAYQTSMKKAGVPAGDALEHQLSRLGKLVSDHEDKHTVATAGARVFERASQALELGLAGKSRDLLLQSDVAAFGAPGMALELDLLLRTGETKKVLEWTAPEHKASLGAAAYYKMRIQALAAAGDYALADAECAELARATGPPEHIERPREMLALVVGRTILCEQPGIGALALVPRRVVGRLRMQQGLTSLTGWLMDEADARVLRGLLALEQGEVGRARSAFREAVALWGDPAAAASGAGLDFSGRVVAQACLRWLE